MNQNETDQPQGGRIIITDRVFLGLAFVLEGLWLGLLAGGVIYPALSMLKSIR